jgi:hypothetical protein
MSILSELKKEFIIFERVSSGNKDSNLKNVDGCNIYIHFTSVLGGKIDIN